MCSTTLVECLQLEDMSVAKLAQQLVQINSVTPDGNSEQAKQSGELELAMWLSKFFQSKGFETQLQTVQKNRPNLIVRPNKIPKLPVVALQAHMDTVDVEGMTVGPFGGEIRDGLLFGRGACDVKGPMAAAITAMLEWYQQNQNPHFELIFLATMGEETGTIGARHFAQNGFPIDLMIVGEPTNLNPVIGHKGLWRFCLETYGKASHSSMPELGENAIDKMMGAFDLIKNKVKPEFESIDGSSLSTTMVHGGSSINIIPDYCRVDVDARFEKGSKIEICRDMLMDELIDTKYTEIQNYPAYISNPFSKTKHFLERALMDQGVEFISKKEPWYSDAGPLSNAGIDTVVWGPGNIKDAHTAEENISIEQLDVAVKILLKFLAVTEEYYGSK